MTSREETQRQSVSGRDHGPLQKDIQTVRPEELTDGPCMAGRELELEAYYIYLELLGEVILFIANKLMI